MRWGQRRADRTGESASATWANKATALICRRSSSRHVKKIARSVLFLSPMLATRQPPANDSDTPGMSQQDTS